MIHELRVYQIRQGRMDDLHRIFTETLNPLFKKLNVETVGFWEAQGSDRRTFVYLLGFEDAAGREKAWQQFVEDSAWKGLSESLGDDAPWEKTESTVLEPTSYSPLK